MRPQPTTLALTLRTLDHKHVGLQQGVGLSVDPPAVDHYILQYTMSMSFETQSVCVQVEGHQAVGLGGHHQPVELVFLPAYGTICSHLWFGLGNLLVGFSSGRVLVLGTDPGSISQELFSRQLFLAPVAHMAFCPYAARAGTALSCPGFKGGGPRVPFLGMSHAVLGCISSQLFQGPVAHMCFCPCAA